MIAVALSSILVSMACCRWQARMFSCNDGGPKRIAMRRSPDSGATWEPTQWIYNDTALEPLPKAQRWAKWNQMGGANFVSAPASSLAGCHISVLSSRLSLFFSSS